MVLKMTSLLKNDRNIIKTYAEQRLAEQNQAVLQQQFGTMRQPNGAPAFGSATGLRNLNKKTGL